MDRRNLLVRAFGFLSYAATTSPSIAQDVSLNSVNVATFADQVRDQNGRNQIFIDVAFVHGWRSILAPRGYEDESWAQRASENRNVVWQGLEQDAAEVIFKSSHSIQEYEKLSFDAYLKNKDDFGSFLNSLGISGDGKAANRIVQSLQEYTLLNASILGKDVLAPAKESFFWPFC